MNIDNLPDFSKITSFEWKDEFQQLLENKINYEKIPLLNGCQLQNLKELQLVRFQCMVQDVLEREYFLRQIKVRNNKTGIINFYPLKYGDIIPYSDDIEVLEEENEGNFQSRECVYCITVPCLNDWVYQSWKNKHRTSLMPSSESCSRLKRSCENESNEMEIDQPTTTTTTTTNNEISPTSLNNKRQRIESDIKNRIISNNSNNINQIVQLNFPYPHPDAQACLIKLPSPLALPLLNEVIEVVGFISMSTPTPISSDSEETIPPSLLPQLYALSVKKLEHWNPLYDSPSSEIVISCAASIREDFKLFLTELLLGDGLAAEYLLCHLISGIYMRREMDTLGKICLNITRTPKEFNLPGRVHEILKDILTHSTYEPMSLVNLNKSNYMPRKDYDTNKLTPGKLQMAKQTYIILDEMRMEAGTLDAQGLQNVTTIGNMMRHQEIEYDFKFYKLKFNTEFPVVVFSEGKSLFPCDLVVPLQPESSHLSTIEEVYKAVKHFLTVDRPQGILVDRLRSYITCLRLECAKKDSYRMSEEAQETIQKYYVQKRQRLGSVYSAADLHTLIAFSRYYTLSFGQTTLSLELMRDILSLEDKREERQS